MNDLVSTALDIVHQIDAATGGFASHSVERVADGLLDKALQKGREKLRRKTWDKIIQSKAEISEDYSARTISEILKHSDGVTNDKIVDLWANLLAKALTGDDHSIRPMYYEIIEKLAPEDALLISIVGSELSSVRLSAQDERSPRHASLIREKRKHYLLTKFKDENALSFSIDALERLGILTKRGDYNLELSILGKGFYTTVCAPILSEEP